MHNFVNVLLLYMWFEPRRFKSDFSTNADQDVCVAERSVASLLFHLVTTSVAEEDGCSFMEADRESCSEKNRKRICY